MRILEVSDSLSPGAAQQVFAIGSGIAVGLSGFVLARELKNINSIPTKTVLAATLFSTLFITTGAIVLVRAMKGSR